MEAQICVKGIRTKRKKPTCLHSYKCPAKIRSFSNFDRFHSDNKYITDLSSLPLIIKGAFGSVERL